MTESPGDTRPRDSFLDLLVHRHIIRIVVITELISQSRQVGPGHEEEQAKREDWRTGPVHSVIRLNREIVLQGAPSV